MRGPLRIEIICRQLRSWGRPGYFDVIDEVSGRAGVELLHPYWDADLVKFCLSLPSSVQFRDGWTRWIQRSAARDVVPAEIAWRVNKGGMTEVQGGIVTSRAGQIEALLATQGGAAGDYLDLAKLSERWVTFSSTGDLLAAQDLAIALNLGIWLAEHR